MMMNFTTKTALITGAATGIGAASARKLCEQKVSALMLLDIAAPALQLLADELTSEFPATRVVTCIADIANEQALRSALQPLLQQLERSASRNH